jgi:amidase
MREGLEMSLLSEGGAIGLVQRMATREVSPVEVMRETLARIDAVNGAVNAIVSLRDREALMGEARLAEAMPPSGPLHGLPIAVKDLCATKGIRSTWGAPHLANFIPDADEATPRKLRAAGAILIGKTNVPMYGLGSHSTNPVFGPTRNPFDLARTAGGSSGGAGAALATGMLALADGSDMMGSLRNPAAWNDVYGFRPTVGLVQGDAGEAWMQARLATHGPMARSVTDLELLLSVMSAGVYAPLDTAPRAPRVGWLGDWGGALPMEAGILDLAERAVRQMEGVGWFVTALDPPMPAPELWQSWTDLRSFTVTQERAAEMRDPAIAEGLNAQVRWETARGLAMTGETVERAAALRLKWLRVLEALFQRFDVLVLPSAQVWPFPVEWDWPREIAGVAMDTYHRWMEVVVPASLAGLPVVNLPAGFGANGLPGGVQMIARHGADATLLAWAKAYEAAIGPRAVVTPTRNA